MKVVNVFLRNPCVGWNPINRLEFKDDYEKLSDFLLDLTKIGGGFQLENSKVEKIGNAYEVSLDMRSLYAVKNPDYNQAHYQARCILLDAQCLSKKL